MACSAWQEKSAGWAGPSGKGLWNGRAGLLVLLARSPCKTQDKNLAEQARSVGAGRLVFPSSQPEAFTPHFSTLECRRTPIPGSATLAVDDFERASSTQLCQGDVAEAGKLNRAMHKAKNAQRAAPAKLGILKSSACAAAHRSAHPSVTRHLSGVATIAFCLTWLLNGLKRTSSLHVQSSTWRLLRKRR